jgi:hypothetical protein
LSDRDSKASRYKNGQIDGRVSALWPGSVPHFLQAIANPRWEGTCCRGAVRGLMLACLDYEWEPMDNPFSYLGNGFTMLEMRGDDTSWYLEVRYVFRMHSRPKAVSRTQRWTDPCGEPTTFLERSRPSKRLKPFQGCSIECLAVYHVASILPWGFSTLSMISYFKFDCNAMCALQVLPQTSCVPVVRRTTRN